MSYPWTCLAAPFPRASSCTTCLHAFGASRLCARVAHFTRNAAIFAHRPFAPLLLRTTHQIIPGYPNIHENENITRKASWHRTYPIPRVQHYSATASACGFGTAGCTIQGPRPDPHTQVGSWHRHLMTGAAKRVPSLHLRRAAAMAACGVSSAYAKICPACPRIIATPSSRRMYITCCATAVVWGCVLSRRTSRCELRAIFQSPTRTAPIETKHT